MAVLVAMALAVCLPACGGSEGGGDEGSAAATSSSRGAQSDQKAAAPERTSDPVAEADESDAAAAYAAFIDYLNWESGGGACDRVTGSFKRAVGADGSRKNCLRTMEALFKSSETMKGKRKVAAVKVKGNKATLTVRAKSGATRKITMVKHDGQWRIDGGEPWK